MHSKVPGIFRLASVGSYIDALSALMRQMSPSERSTLIELEKRLHEQWGLGRNVLLNWCLEEDGVSLLQIPHYAISEYVSQGEPEPVNSSAQSPRHESEVILRSLLTGKRRRSASQLDKAAWLLGVDRIHLQLRTSALHGPAQQQIIEQMIKRYSISYVPSRAVVLLDIVGFGQFSPFEQMIQLNSLSYSINTAHSKLASKGIGVDFSRSTTGDGFYIWNHDVTVGANINLYQFMHLVLVENAIARSHAPENCAPELRAGFHVGPCYEFYQAEGLSPTLYNYIVGDVTIALARMIDHAVAGQILVGEFDETMPLGDELSGGTVRLSSIDFVTRVTNALEQISGLELSGEHISAIKCYLTGAQLENGQFTVRRIVITDKHGATHNIYNAKINVYRDNADPIFLGIQDRELGASLAHAERTEHVRPLAIT